MTVVFWLAFAFIAVLGFRATISALGGHLRGEPGALRAGLRLLAVAGLIGLVGYLTGVGFR